MKVYLCGVTLQHELGEIPIKVYPDLALMKRHNSCWKECGIVEMELSNPKWLEPQRLQEFFSREANKPGKLATEHEVDKCREDTGKSNGAKGTTG